MDCTDGDFEIDVTDEGVTFATSVNSAMLVMPDIELCGGVVHAIDTVLIPECIIDGYDIRVPTVPMDDGEDMTMGMYGGYGGYGRK